MVALRLLLLTSGLLALWQMLVLLTQVPAYILPGPLPVFQALVEHGAILFKHLKITAFEIIAGLFIGTLLGASCALTMIISPMLKRWMQPVL